LAFFNSHYNSHGSWSPILTRSTTEHPQFNTETIPVSFPLSWGKTFPTAFAAPVEAGMIFWDAPQPPIRLIMGGTWYDGDKGD
jgi:hypothetical protein